MKRLFIITLLLCSAVWGFGQNRLALVIGNGDYESGKLVNPAKDANAISEALHRLGFSVTLTVNRTLAEMETDLQKFSREIAHGDTVLLYFAGHGVQTDGQNYLLPIDNGSIQSEAALNRKAIVADEYIRMITEAGAGLDIVILDACRDNPIPSRSRSGARGLTVIQAPRDSETLIVFSTRAGETALDGDGANSVFTEALLSEIEKPDLDVINLFNSVGALVKVRTGGRQVPTLYTDPLSEKFYFVTSKELAERKRLENSETEEALQSINQEISRLTQLIGEAKDKEERQRLEIEKQRQMALEALKKIEAEHIERELSEYGERQKQTELAAEAEAAALSAGESREKELQQLASSKREALRQLQSRLSAGDPDSLIAHVDTIGKAIREVEDGYASLRDASIQRIEEEYQKQYKALNAERPGAWESDQEFELRIKSDKERIAAERDSLKEKAETDYTRELRKNSTSLEDQRNRAMVALESSLWTFGGDAVSLRFGAYDRNKKVWPFVLSSKNPDLPLYELPLQVDATALSKEDLISLDAMIKADAIAPEVTINYELLEYGRYGINLRSIRLKDLVNDLVVYELPLPKKAQLGVFTSGKRTHPRYDTACTYLDWEDDQGVRINGVPVERQQLVILPAGTNRVDQIIDGYAYSEKISIQAGRTNLIRLERPNTSTMQLVPTVLIYEEIEPKNATADSTADTVGTVGMELFLHCFRGEKMTSPQSPISIMAGFRSDLYLDSQEAGYHFRSGPEVGVDINASILSFLWKKKGAEDGSFLDGSLFLYATASPIYDFSDRGWTFRTAAGISGMEFLGLELYAYWSGTTPSWGIAFHTNAMYLMFSKFFAFSLKPHRIPVDD